jgi:hypothetical protein
MNAKETAVNRRSYGSERRVATCREDAGNTTTVDRPGDDPRKECEECGNARGSNVRYYPT